MRAHRPIIFGLVMSLAGCGVEAGSDDPVGATTTTMESTPTTTAASTTTMRPTTTTSPPATTTSPPATTTTLLEGNWAEEPLVMAEWALGWWDGITWVDVDADTDLPVQGGEDYQVALLGSDAILEGGPQENYGCSVVGEPLPGVRLDPDALEVTVESDPANHGVIHGVAISAPWALTPRPVTELGGGDDLEAIAVDLLNQAGFETDSAAIFQAVQADLDGDGSVETIVVAEDTEISFEPTTGVYSLAFVLSSASDAPEIVAESIVPEDSEFGGGEVNRISGVADLSGDGVMELVISGGGWESSWLTVYEYGADGLTSVLHTGCGV